MKKIEKALLLITTCVTLSVAGANTNPITIHSIEDEKKAESVQVSRPVSFVENNISKEDNETLSSLYIAGGLTLSKYDSRCLSSSNPSCDNQSSKLGFLLRAGYDYNEYVGAEARAMITGNLTHFGLFAKPMYPISEDFNLYALGGIAKTKTDTDFRNTDVTGLAFGIGLEYDLSDDEEEKELKYDREFDGMANQERGLGLFIDYEKLYYKSNAPTLYALSAGITYDF